jgi:predicted nucleotidyltransferase
MTRPSIALEAHRADIRRIVASNRATNVRIFGSVVRGEDDDTSDLDVLVDALPGATLLDLGAIQIELEEILGVAVDVLTPMDLPEKFRQKVLDEARAV